MFFFTTKEVEVVKQPLLACGKYWTVRLVVYLLDPYQQVAFYFKPMPKPMWLRSIHCQTTNKKAY